MVRAVKNLGRGCPLSVSFSKKLGKSAETGPEKSKNAQKTSIFSTSICARNLTNPSIHATGSAEQK